MTFWIRSFSLLLLFSVTHVYAETALVNCPARYVGDERLVDGTMIRFPNGDRLKENEQWKYKNGDRISDGSMLKYPNGNILADSISQWRYANGGRLKEGRLIRYPNGAQLRDADGRFFDQSGNQIEKTFMTVGLFSSQEVQIQANISVTSETIEVRINYDQSTQFTIVIDANEALLASQLICSVQDKQGPSRIFSIQSKAGSLNVMVNEGYSPVEIKKALEELLLKYSK